MHRLPGHFSSACSVSNTTGPAAPAQLLPATEARPLIDLVGTTVRRIHTLIAFLRSNDPASRLDPATQASMVSRCWQAADTDYLRDVWPAVGDGLKPPPADTPPPAFSSHHRDEALDRAAAVSAVAKECSAMADAKLRILMQPVENELIEINSLLARLPATCNPPACVHARELLRNVRQRPTAHDGEGCRIAKYDAWLNTPRKPVSLKDTREAVEALMSLRRGRSGNLTDLSQQNQPRYHERWTGMIALLEKDQLASFRRELSAMREWQADLLHQASLASYSPMPGGDAHFEKQDPGWKSESE